MRNFQTPSLTLLEVALLLERPHPARPDGEDDSELATRVPLHLPVFPRSAASGGGPRKNRGQSEACLRISLPSNSPSGQAGWGLTHWLWFLGQSRRNASK